MSIDELTTKLAFYNPWWQTGKVPAAFLPDYKRPVFTKIQNYLKKTNRAILLKGPRQVGKSTLIYQTIAGLLDEGIDPRKIIYGSFEDGGLQVDPEKILETLAQVSNQIQSKITGYVFLDEAQYLTGWEFLVKKYLDAKLPVRFFISGSAATLLTQKKESLSGRVVEEVIWPFSFAECWEYFESKIKINSRASQGAIYEANIKAVWRDYLRFGGFPRLFTEPEELKMKLLRQDVVDRAVFRDLVTRFDVQNPQILEKLFEYLGKNTAGIVNLTSLSSFLGISRATVEAYISYLESSYLLFRLDKYAKRLAESLRSNPKVHVIDPGLGQLLGANGDDILETVMATYLWQKDKQTFFWRDEFHEVDFYLEAEKLPIEIKNNESLEIPAGLRFFMEKQRLKKGIVVYLGKEAERKIDSLTIQFIPVWKFLLEKVPESLAN